MSKFFTILHLPFRDFVGEDAPPTDIHSKYIISYIFECENTFFVIKYVKTVIFRTRVIFIGGKKLARHEKSAESVAF